MTPSQVGVLCTHEAGGDLSFKSQAQFPERGSQRYASTKFALQTRKL